MFLLGFFVFVPAFLSIFINWLLIKFSFNLGVRNINESEKRWQERKPSLGGISFYLNFLIFFIGILFYLMIHKIEIDNIKSIIGLFLSASIGFFIGLIDDAKNTNPLLKLMGQLICGLVLVYFGITIPISTNIIWNAIFTVFWTVFLMNSINMLDNMDGLTSLISLYIITAIITLHFNISVTFEIAIMMVVTSSILGFLYFNWSPSKIYMGDSGSQFLGIFLAYISILYIWDYRIDNGGYFQINQLLIPFFIFTIPIFDTSTVFIHRILRGQSPFVGGRDHLSHHLVYSGLKEWQAVLTLGIINLIFSAIALYRVLFTVEILYFDIYLFTIWIGTFLFLQWFYVHSLKHKKEALRNINNAS
jgi:UDP-GlcNAc:undecaprenyl-phosphate GlcNAc-1-phosphate transferase